MVEQGSAESEQATREVEGGEGGHGEDIAGRGSRPHSVGHEERKDKSAVPSPATTHPRSHLQRTRRQRHHDVPS